MPDVVIEVRPASEAEAEAVTALLVAQLREHRVRTPEAKIASAVRGVLGHPGRGRILVALDQGRAVGVAALSFVWPIEHGDRSAWLEVQMCAAGTTASGRSMLPTVTSTERGRAVSRKVSAVPQAAHRWRTARGVARSSAGVPAVKTSAAAGNVAHVTKGAPVVRRQMVQWQWLTSRVRALTR